MNYRQTLQAVDTLKALTILGIEGSGKGSYDHSPAPSARLAAGNIVSLAMESKGVQWEEAKQILGKATRQRSSPAILK